MIKFRTWYPKGKKMSTPDKYAGDVFIRQNGEKVICIDTGEWEDGYQVDFMKDNLDLVAMLSTGLKDKNGKEIYEGDIVMANTPYCTKDPKEIVWDDKRAGFFMKADFVAYDPKNLHKLSGFKMEVIGNIYENPELLTPPTEQ